MKSDFEKELKQLINKHSLENESDTPDVLLAEFIMKALQNFNHCVNMRDRWKRSKPKKT